MMNKMLREVLDFLKGMVEHGSLLECTKKLKHYNVDRNDRVANIRTELESALLQDLEVNDEDGERDYDFTYAQLEKTWQKLSEEYGVVDRDSMASDEVLSSIFYYLEFGFYPPPELLLLLHERFDVYMAGEGDVSLEEAFFGPPHRKVGNYAARRRSNGLYGFSSFHLLQGKKQGFSQHEIAEKFIEENKLHVEPESLLRAVRRKKKKVRRFYSDK